jgi:hypothetical protein
MHLLQDFDEALRTSLRSPPLPATDRTHPLGHQDKPGFGPDKQIQQIRHTYHPSHIYLSRRMLVHSPVYRGP